MSLIFTLNILFVIAPSAFGANPRELKSIVESREKYFQPESCENTFRDHQCQMKINKAGEKQRTNYIDCNQIGESSLTKGASCLGSATIGASLGFLTVVAPQIMLPIVGSMLVVAGVTNDAECSKNLEFKIKIARPLAALHGDQFALRAVKSMVGCAALEQRVFRSSESALKIIQEKQRKAKEFDRRLKSRPTQKTFLEGLFPKDLRILTMKEEKFLRVMQAIKAENAQLRTVVESINRSYFCSSPKIKREIFCGMIGGVAGSIRGKALAHSVLEAPRSSIQNFNGLNTAQASSQNEITATGLRKVFTFPGRAGSTFHELAETYPKLADRKASLPRILPDWRGIDNLNRIPFKKSNGFRAIDDEEMKKRALTLPPDIQETILKVFNRLRNKEELTVYFQKLFEDAAEEMAKKGGDASKIMLEEGVVSTEAISKVVVARLKTEGERFTTLHFKRGYRHGTGPLRGGNPSTKNEEFRSAITQGPFFDYNYSPWERGGHGVYTHMIQRDIVKDVVNSSTRGNPQRFWDFLGSKKGIHWWVDLFDSQSLSFSRPEELTYFITHELSGLGG